MQLPLLDHVHGLDSGEQFPRTPERLESEHRICDSLHSPVILLDDVVEDLALAQLNVKAGVLIDAVDSGRVGSIFVDGYLLRQAMQVDGSLQTSAVLQPYLAWQ